jgi:hypothetical protein
MEPPRVTLEMIKSVQRTLHEYRRCFAVMFLLDPQVRLPKDVLQMVWARAAGPLEDLLQQLLLLLAQRPPPPQSSSPTAAAAAEKRKRAPTRPLVFGYDVDNDRSFIDLTGDDDDDDK